MVRDDARTVSGRQCVMSAIKKLNSMTSDKGDGHGESVAEYIFKVREPDYVLFKVGSNVQLGVSICKESMAMHDVMYKDFYNDRWPMDYVSMLQRWGIKKSKYERSQELCGEFQI